MIKKIFLFPLLFILLLTGCSTQKGISKYSTPNLNENGVLLLPITDRALFTPTGISFTVENTEGRKNTLSVDDWDELFSLKKSGVKQFFRGFELPEGTYKFVSWKFIQTEGKPAEAPKEPLTFNIKKGEIIYIGHFDAVRFLGNGRFRDNYVEDLKKFQSLYPWLKIDVKKTLVKTSEWLLPEGKPIKDLAK